MSEASKEDICLTDVTKIFRLGVFKRKVGVEGLSLSVPRGKVIGLLGPNGSGKSTTIKMILGFLRPTSGEILVCGYPEISASLDPFSDTFRKIPDFRSFSPHRMCSITMVVSATERTGSGKTGGLPSRAGQSQACRS